MVRREKAGVPAVSARYLSVKVLKPGLRPVSHLTSDAALRGGVVIATLLLRQAIALLSDDALAASQLRRLAERAADSGIRVAYEALALGRHVNTYDHARRIVEAAGHPALGTCLDSFHILARGSGPKGIADDPGDKVFFLQLTDAPLLAMDVLQWSRHYRCFPGQGDLDVAGLLRHVLATGYHGPLSLEVFNDVFRQAEAGPAAGIDALRSLVALQKTVKEGELPTAVVLTGVPFAELVTPDVEPVAALLTALGFTRTERYRGKPVDLWEQGATRVLLNTGAAARRAEALLAPVLSRRRATGDVLLDAVAAPDGTELFFCATDRPGHPSWRRDFTPTGEPVEDSRVRAVDHVALTQPWHQFASLFHRAVLGLDAQGSVDVADPYGLLRSRAYSAPGGSVRIALGVGPGPADDWDRAQHIALTTDDDVVAAAHRFRAAGGTLLAVPGNYYYDDLDARYDFAPGELDTYRELGILYDHDAHGTFRHCCARTVGRVFFELTQRDDGYRGYGAQNAPVRPAAQHEAGAPR